MKTFTLTKRQAQEIAHKLCVLAESEDLCDDYSIATQQAAQLRDSVPLNGGTWMVPDFGRDALVGEIRNAAHLCREALAENCRSENDTGGMLSEHRLGAALERIADQIDR